MGLCKRPECAAGTRPYADEQIVSSSERMMTAREIFSTLEMCRPRGPHPWEGNDLINARTFDLERFDGVAGGHLHVVVLR